MNRYEPTAPSLRSPARGEATARGKLSIRLPRADRALDRFELSAPRNFPQRTEGRLNRIAFAAVHVVADPLADVDPWLGTAIDWERTIAFREHIWGLGLGVAEAMDTAQRGMGLDWPTSLELIRRSVAAARPRGALVFSGVGTDQLAPEAARTLDDVLHAYEQQVAAVEAIGGRIVLMASRALARIGRSADDYARVYGSILAQAREPVIIHWLGDMFDPQLAGYWGSSDLDAATDAAVAIIAANAGKVDGVKISLLDKEREIAMRRRLPAGVRMYTGDDFNYAELIAGDGAALFRCAAGDFRRDRAGRGGRAGAACRRRHGRLSRDPGAHRRAVAPYLPGTDPVLQDRRRVHGLSQRAPGSLHHGRRAGERAFDAPSRRHLPARRRGRPAARSGAGGSPHAQRAGGARGGS